MLLRLQVPYPPSANHLYTVARGRKILSAKGRAYHESVVWKVRQQNPLKERFLGRLEVTLHIHAPDNRRRDLANCEKAVLDALTQAQVWEDDCLIDRLVLERGDLARPHGYVEVFIHER